MRKSSMDRRLSANPVRISLLERDEKNAGAFDRRRTQTLKAKNSMGALGSDNLQSLKSRTSSSSTDRLSGRKSNLKPPSTTKGLSHYTPSGPITPAGHSSRYLSVLPTGTRGKSPSLERASGLGSQGPKKDTRPLNEREYQNAMIQKVDAYFNAIDKVTMLNPNGSFRPVTLKMFVEVSSLLLNLLLVINNLTINNYIEELPKLAKKVNYPGTVNKSWLRTANAKHSWGQVLGWISWLVELCEINDSDMNRFTVESIAFGEDDIVVDIKKVELFNMFRAYKAWNDEDSAEEEAAMNNYLQQAVKIQGAKTEDFDEVMKLHKEADEKYRRMNEDFKNICVEVIDLKNILNNLIMDESEQEKYLEQCKAFNATEEMEIKSMEKQCQEIRITIEKCETEIKELTNIIKNQRMTSEQRDEIIKECNTINSFFVSFEGYLKDIKKELYDYELNIETRKNKLNDLLLSYNKYIVMNLYVDETINLEDLKMPVEGLLYSDTMDILKERNVALENWKSVVETEINECEKAMKDQESAITIQKETYKKISQGNKEFARRLEEYQHRMNEIKMANKEKEAKYQQKIRMLQNEIKSLQEEIPAIDAVQAELEENRDKSQALLRRYQFLEEQATYFFTKVYEKVNQRRKNYIQTMQNLTKEIEKLKNSTFKN